jgi:lysozyme
MKSKILAALILTIIFAIIPYFIVQHANPPQKLYETNESKVSSESVVSNNSNISSSKSSQMLSEPSILSLEPKLSGMCSDGMITLKIIDVSNNSKVDNWNTVKTNVDGIYIKATEGSTYTDPAFATFANGAKKAQVPFGFYHYLWPNSNAKNIKQQADYFCNAIKKYKYELYPVLDIEVTNGQNAKTISSNVKTFSEEFSRVANQKIMIYCSPNFANHYLTDKSLTKYPLWIADYGVNDPSETIIWNTFDVWQYGVNISIPGVSGKVDGDIATNNIFLDINSAPKL